MTDEKKDKSLSNGRGDHIDEEGLVESLQTMMQAAQDVMQEIPADEAQALQTYLTEYNSIDETLDALNAQLDKMENKNDSIRERARELLRESREARMQPQQLDEKPQ